MIQMNDVLKSSKNSRNWIVIHNIMLYFGLSIIVKIKWKQPNEPIA